MPIKIIRFLILHFKDTNNNSTISSSNYEAQVLDIILNSFPPRIKYPMKIMKIVHILLHFTESSASESILKHIHNTAFCMDYSIL